MRDGVEKVTSETAAMSLEAAFKHRAAATRSLEDRGYMGEKVTRQAVIVDLGNGRVF